MGLKTRQLIFSFSFEERNSEITKLLYDKDIRLLLADSKNNMVKFWNYPIIGLMSKYKNLKSKK